MYNDAETIPISNVQQKHRQIKIHTDASEIYRNNTQKITTLRISLFLLLFFLGGECCIGSSFAAHGLSLVAEHGL